MTAAGPKGSGRTGDALTAVSVVVIGDEILSGATRDTNAGWLARQLNGVGVPVRRMQVVGDDVDEIAEAVTTEMQRLRPRLVVTMGGLGPTHDDVTAAGVAQACGQPLVPHDELAADLRVAVQRLAAKSDIDATHVDPSAVHALASLPAGSRLLFRSTRWMPPIRLDVDGGFEAANGATVVMLPGVPMQLRHDVTRGLLPLLRLHGVPLIVRDVEHRVDELMLVTQLDRLRRRHPGVQWRAYPGDPSVLRLTGRSDHAVDRAASEALAILGCPTG